MFDLRRCLLALTMSLPVAASAADLPSVEQAHAAYRRAIEADLAQIGPGASSPLSAMLLESMKIRAVQGCQPLAGARLACIVQIDAGARSGYQAYPFEPDGAQWRISERKDIPAPAPDLAQAQQLFRERLAGEGERQTDEKTRKLFAQAATAAVIATMDRCELDRDSGAVECQASMALPDGKHSGPLRFELNARQWTLLPR